MTHNEMPKDDSTVMADLLCEEIMTSPKKDVEKTIKRALLKAYRYGQRNPLLETLNK